MPRAVLLPALFVLATLTATSAGAQPPAPLTPPAQPAPPDPAWSGSLGFGIALTEGNRDSSTINLSYELRRRVATSPIVFQSKGLLLRGSTEGELTANRLGAEARIDRRFGERTSVFAQTQYLRDRFKEIDYLVAPTVGVSHLFQTSDAGEFGVNVGVGTVWEKDRDESVEFDGAVTAGQQFKRALSATAEFTQSLSALWKIRDLGDSLYTLNIGVSASVTTRTQLKFEVVDTFKNRQSDPALLKNDVSLLVSFVFRY